MRCYISVSHPCRIKYSLSPQGFSPQDFLNFKENTINILTAIYSSIQNVWHSWSIIFFAFLLFKPLCFFSFTYCTTGVRRAKLGRDGEGQDRKGWSQRQWHLPESIPSGSSSGSSSLALSLFGLVPAKELIPVWGNPWWGVSRTVGIPFSIPRLLLLTHTPCSSTHLFFSTAAWMVGVMGRQDWATSQT